MTRTRPLDATLLRRFGLVRAVGGAAYFVTVAVLFGIFGTRVWPLALGVPILAVVTTGYFVRSYRYPRAAVIVSLAADAVVLGGAIAFLGGTGSGLVLLYAIVVVSAGLLLGPGAAGAFTALTVGLALLQLLAEQIGYPPVLLHRPELGERLPVLLVSLAGLLSVGYLSATYASRLHELIAEGAQAAEAVRRRGRRRRSFFAHASVEVRSPLRQIEGIAETLDQHGGTLSEDARRELAARLRMGVMLVDAEIGRLADLGLYDETAETPPEVVSLPRVCSDCVVQLGERLDGYEVELDVPPLKVVADPRAARRVAFNLLENVVEHTPPGTRVRVTGVTTPGHGVLVVTDNGPGVPDAEQGRLFEAPDDSRMLTLRQAAGLAVPAEKRRVGLPLVRELCEAMGAEVRYERPAAGGARFLVAFRLAPSAAPSADDRVDVSTS